MDCRLTVTKLANYTIIVHLDCLNTKLIDNYKYPSSNKFYKNNGQSLLTELRREHFHAPYESGNRSPPDLTPLSPPLIVKGKISPLQFLQREKCIE